ncbi:uncharacterized protein MYCFIDRAFT_180644 [Pseudocercospora fijiensis CIRAD86]|uniref:Uncharacterized protein n=1 Tax=Pseudocercospora fijiensis (strain CIRAD86) TaxID=383855 RepID=M3AHZ7_PSEFD|nr:uncharacterized protein MYCFIDRAFT_180644 [Pseudocercospora fijiensis CIRAD86]EME76823.1 hypothetical protein MYCFIDRAFT_180644 [Pseudocercospora fijiensis CIRAD86]
MNGRAACRPPTRAVPDRNPYLLAFLQQYAELEAWEARLVREYTNANAVLEHPTLHPPLGNTHVSMSLRLRLRLRLHSSVCAVRADTLPDRLAAADAEGADSDADAADAAASYSTQRIPGFRTPRVSVWLLLLGLFSSPLVLLYRRPLPVPPGFWEQSAGNLSSLLNAEPARVNTTLQTRALALCAIDHARCLLSPSLVDVAKVRVHQRPLGSSLGYCIPFQCSATTGLLDGARVGKNAFIEDLHIKFSTLESTFADMVEFDSILAANQSILLDTLLQASLNPPPPPRCTSSLPTRAKCLFANWIRANCGRCLLHDWFRLAFAVLLPPLHFERSIQQAATVHRRTSQLLQHLAADMTTQQTMRKDCIAKANDVQTTILWPITALSTEDSLQQVDVVQYYFRYIIPNACLGRDSPWKLQEWLDRLNFQQLEQPQGPDIAAQLTDSSSAYEARATNIQRLGYWTEETRLMGITRMTREFLDGLRQRFTSVDAMLSTWRTVLLDGRQEEEEKEEAPTGAFCRTASPQAPADVKDDDSDNPVIEETDIVVDAAHWGIIAGERFTGDHILCALHQPTSTFKMDGTEIANLPSSYQSTGYASASMMCTPSVGLCIASATSRPGDETLAARFLRQTETYEDDHSAAATTLTTEHSTLSLSKKSFFLPHLALR